MQRSVPELDKSKINGFKEKAQSFKEKTLRLRDFALKIFLGKYLLVSQ